MEALSSWKFPFARDPKPLAQLSPERVNAASRPTSTISSSPTKTTEETQSQDQYRPHSPSPFSSPSRRAKANLFAEYHPHNNTPPKCISGFALAQSPSLPEINALRGHGRTNSDVQGLVKRFEHLDVRDRDAEIKDRNKKHEAELRRAQIAREEAESDVKRLREDIRLLERENEAGRERERAARDRLETVMQDRGSSRELDMSQSAAYEKELRKSRKEAFKFSSTILKLQEELKSTRNSLRITQSGFEVESQKARRKEQERLATESQLISQQEQMARLTQSLVIVESEKDALKQDLKAEEIARIAAEGMIALPASQHMDRELLDSPSKRTRSPLSDDKENMGVIPKKTLETSGLSEELETERVKRRQAEELVEFLRVECMFHCCSCRNVSTTETAFTAALDAELAVGVERIRRGMQAALTPLRDQQECRMDLEPTEPILASQDVSATEADPPVEASVLVHAIQASHEDDLDRSITMTLDEPNAQPSLNDRLREEPASAGMAVLDSEAISRYAPIESETTSALQSLPPSTPSYQSPQFGGDEASIRTVTTTTTVPMLFTPVSKASLQPRVPSTSSNSNSAYMDVLESRDPLSGSYGAEGADAVPATPTFDRAAALAAIEYRRGRARSMADGLATPRKQMLEGVGVVGRRDISAPALGQKRNVPATVDGGIKTRSGSAGRGRGRL